MKKIKNLPYIQDMNEFAEFIVSFWVSMIETGRFEMPFKGSTEVDNIANMIRFTQTAEDRKIFSGEQIDELKKRMKVIIQSEFLTRTQPLYAYTAYGNPHYYLERLFRGIEVPRDRFPFALYTFFFKSRIDYEDSIKNNPERYGGQEGIKNLMQQYPAGGVFCSRKSGEGWKILACIEPEYL
jgi:hypothetical protein